jgi:ABC-type sugar transport system permease subunit
MSAYNYTRVFEASGVFIVVTMVVFLGFFIALLRRSDIKGHTNHFIIWLLLVICIVLYAIAGVIMACINLNIDLC